MIYGKMVLSTGKVVFFEASDRDLTFWTEVTDDENDEALNNWYDDAFETLSHEEFKAATAS